ncbi:MAG TPA: phosphoribosylaminoimidazolesuccinocarboxamide synthase [Thermoplasmatales archaeon]|nr:phosphoribosylaminoimidazolesuccinocarboxamide synthase [Thermoplasmatales archaeon]
MLVRKGKVKEVYDIGGGKLKFVFTDNISVFDKIVPTKIRWKGAVLCGTACFWFERCNKIGIKNHFVERNKMNEMIVRKFDIVDKGEVDKKNYLIPLEVIARYYVAGSFYERNKDKYEYGEKLDEPIIEFTTKFEKYDRLIDEKEAMKIGGLKKEEIEEIKEVVIKIDYEMAREVERRGLIHVDGKKEFALDEDRNLVVVDTFGTPDEDRFWDMKKYKENEFIEMSKEFVRNYYKKIGYYDKLKNARKNKIDEPPIPPLPDNVSEEVSNLYIELYEKITGRNFIHT